MPTSGEVIRQIDNVQAFVETVTVHGEGLVRDGIVWSEPIPVWMRPYTEVSQGYPHNRILREDYIDGVSKARAINKEDRAPYGSRNIYGVELRRPLHIAGHTMLVTQATIREAMAGDRVAQMVRQPSEEWFRTAQEICFDVGTAGAFSHATNLPTDAFVPSVLDFDGLTRTQDKSTESADTASATIAHGSHLVQFATRNGQKFAAGHDHINPAVGGAWTRARGRAQADLIKEHPNAGPVDVFVGATVRDAILDLKEAWRGSSSGVGQTPLFAQMIEGGGRDYGATDFGVPEYIGTVDNADYWFVKDMPADLHVAIARGTKPFRVFIGLRDEQGQIEAPFPWTERLHRELRGSRDQAGSEYGYRGDFSCQVQNPVAVAVAKMVA